MAKEKLGFIGLGLRRQADHRRCRLGMSDTGHHGRGKGDVERGGLDHDDPRLRWSGNRPNRPYIPPARPDMKCHEAPMDVTRVHAS